MSTQKLPKPPFAQFFFRGFQKKHWGDFQELGYLILLYSKDKDEDKDEILKKALLKFCTSYSFNENSAYFNNSLQSIKEEFGDPLTFHFSRIESRMIGFDEQFSSLHEKVDGLKSEVVGVKREVDGVKREVDGVKSEMGVFFELSSRRYIEKMYGVQFAKHFYASSTIRLMEGVVEQLNIEQSGLLFKKFWSRTTVVTKMNGLLFEDISYDEELGNCEVFLELLKNAGKFLEMIGESGMEKIEDGPKKTFTSCSKILFKSAEMKKGSKSLFENEFKKSVLGCMEEEFFGMFLLYAYLFNVVIDGEEGEERLVKRKLRPKCFGSNLEIDCIGSIELTANSVFEVRITIGEVKKTLNKDTLADAVTQLIVRLTMFAYVAYLLHWGEMFKSKAPLKLTLCGMIFYMSSTNVRNLKSGLSERVQKVKDTVIQQKILQKLGFNSGNASFHFNVKKLE